MASGQASVTGRDGSIARPGISEISDFSPTLSHFFQKNVQQFHELSVDSWRSRGVGTIRVVALQNRLSID